MLVPFVAEMPGLNFGVPLFQNDCSLIEGLTDQFNWVEIDQAQEIDRGEVSEKADIHRSEGRVIDR